MAFLTTKMHFLNCKDPSKSAVFFTRILTIYLFLTTNSLVIGEQPKDKKLAAD